MVRKAHDCCNKDGMVAAVSLVVVAANEVGGCAIE